MKYFMLDIETMGTESKYDDIIQIGLLEVTRGDDGYYYPGKSYQRTLHTNQKPKNDWIRKTHKDLLKECAKAGKHNPYEVRQDILEFFKSCGVNELAMLMGLNATTFDVPFLLDKGYLFKPMQGPDNKLQGDYHYRIYELKGSYNFAKDVLKFSSDKELYEAALDACPDIKLPAGKEHQALFDCYKQLKVLNGCIRLVRGEYA